MRVRRPVVRPRRAILAGRPRSADVLLLALSAGVKLEHLRSLASAFDADWDLLAGRRPRRAPVEPGPRSTRARSSRRARDLVARRGALRLRDDLLPGTAGAARRVGRPARGRAGRRGPHATILGDAAYAQGRRRAERRTGRGRPGRGRGRVRRACRPTPPPSASRSSTRCSRRLARWVARGTVEAAPTRAGRRAGWSSTTCWCWPATCSAARTPRSGPTCSERYQRLLLDEFQDTDPIQIELAVRIAGGAAGGRADWRDVAVPAGSLFVVGDPKQSIYRFRRADIAHLPRRRRTTSARHVELTTNFRTRRTPSSTGSTPCSAGSSRPRPARSRRTSRCGRDRRRPGRRAGPGRACSARRRTRQAERG